MTTLLRDEAYERLSNLLDEGALPSDATLSLSSLAELLDMSRTPIRDAVQRLSDEGRLEVLPSRGIRVHVPSAGELLHHYHFSCAIEGYCAAELARSRATPAGERAIGRLESLHAELAAHLDPAAGDFTRYFALDRSFHQVLLESLDDAYISSLARTRMGFIGHPELQRPEDGALRARVFACHTEILDAIKTGDAKRAFEGIRTHARLMVEATRTAHPPAGGGAHAGCDTG